MLCCQREGMHMRTSFSVAIGRALGAMNGRSSRRTRKALVIPPAVPGSLGDAAMIAASSRSLRAQGVEAVDLLYGQDWELDEKVDRHVAGERFFYRQSPLQLALLVSRLGDYSEIYFVGADVIDGAYNPISVNGRLFLLAEAARTGKKATILGASYNRNPEETTRRTLRSLPAAVTVCARDPLSRTRMEKALDRPVRQVADLAFLLAPRDEHPEAREAIAWIEARRAAGDQVIGLNANYIHAEKDPALPQALQRLVAELLRRELSILLIPHDTRSQRPDRKLLEEAVAATGADEKARIRMLPPVSPGVVRAVTPKLDLLATGRMHAAILGLSAGTPAFCFAYQDKFEGMFQLFELDGADLLSTPESLSRNPVQVAARIVDRLAEKESLRRHIAGRVRAVLELSRQNFL